MLLYQRVDCFFFAPCCTQKSTRPFRWRLPILCPERTSSDSKSHGKTYRHETGRENGVTHETPVTHFRKPTSQLAHVEKFTHNIYIKKKQLSGYNYIIIIFLGINNSIKQHNDMIFPSSPFLSHPFASMSFCWIPRRQDVLFSKPIRGVLMAQQPA